jgi:hypothetical protein
MMSGFEKYRQQVVWCYSLKILYWHHPVNGQRNSSRCKIIITHNNVNQSVPRWCSWANHYHFWVLCVCHVVWSTDRPSAPPQMWSRILVIRGKRRDDFRVKTEWVWDVWGMLGCHYWCLGDNCGILRDAWQLVVVLCVFDAILREFPDMDCCLRWGVKSDTCDSCGEYLWGESHNDI